MENLQPIGNQRLLITHHTNAKPSSHESRVEHSVYNYVERSARFEKQTTGATCGCSSSRRCDRWSADGWMQVRGGGQGDCWVALARKRACDNHLTTISVHWTSRCNSSSTFSTQQATEFFHREQSRSIASRHQATRICISVKTIHNAVYSAQRRKHGQNRQKRSHRQQRNPTRAPKLGIEHETRTMTKRAGVLVGEVSVFGHFVPTPTRELTRRILRCWHLARKAVRTQDFVIRR
jgi:hypothetical protein